MNKLILLTALLSLNVFAGDKVGNGGGQICIPNESCKTLAEAGLRVKSSPNYPNTPDAKPIYIPSLEIIEEVKNILNTIPFPKYVRDSILKRAQGKYGTYLLAETVDPVLFQNIKQQYQSVVQKYSPSLDLSHFDLVAWSDSSQDNHENTNAQTYLLPDFFRLSVRKQALFLIHEGNLRGFPSSRLEPTLALDAKIEELLANPSIYNSINYDLFELALVWKTLYGYVSYTENLTIEFLRRKLQRFPSLEELCNTTSPGNCYTSYDKLLPLARFDSRVVKELNRGLISSVNNRYIYDRIQLSEEYGDLFSFFETFCEANAKKTLSYLRNMFLIPLPLKAYKDPTFPNDLSDEDLRLLVLTCSYESKRQTKTKSNWNIYLINAEITHY